MPQITIEETLEANEIDSALTVAPFLIWSEIIEGARRPLVFLEAFGEDSQLVGAIGETIRFLRLDTPASAYSNTEAEITSSGMSAEEWASSAFGLATVQTNKVIWAARQLTDYLKENYPNIDFLRLALRDMGKSVMEYLDDMAFDAVTATFGHLRALSASLTYGNVVDALALAKKASWFPDAANPPYLIIGPEVEAGLLKDTVFISTERYTTAEIANMVNGEIGRFAGCRVLVTPHLEDTGLAFIIFPSDTERGPVALIEWKRRITMKNEYFTKYAYTYFNVSMRAMPVVVQPKGVIKITMSNTP